MRGVKSARSAGGKCTVPHHVDGPEFNQMLFQKKLDCLRKVNGPNGGMRTICGVNGPWESGRSIGEVDGP